LSVTLTMFDFSQKDIPKLLEVSSTASSIVLKGS